jgi:Protein of unknown function, DUF255
MEILVIKPFTQAKCDSCHWRKLQENTTFNNANVVRLINANYVAVMLDVDKQMDITKQYNISDLPTIIIMDANRNIISTISGYASRRTNEKFELQHWSVGATKNDVIVDNFAKLLQLAWMIIKSVATV